MRRKQRAGLVVKGHSEFGRILITRCRYHRSHHFKDFFSFYIVNKSCIKYKIVGKYKTNGRNTFVRVTSRLACLAKLSGQILTWSGEGKGDTGEMCVLCAQGILCPLFKVQKLEQIHGDPESPVLALASARKNRRMADSTARMSARLCELCFWCLFLFCLRC